MNRTNYLHPKPFSKPLSSSDGKYYIGLNKEWIDRAYRDRKKIMIEVLGVGRGLYSADQWMQGSHEVERVYKYPDRPMKIVMNYFKKGHGFNNYADRNVSISKDIKLRLGEIFRAKYGNNLGKA